MKASWAQGLVDSWLGSISSREVVSGIMVRLLVLMDLVYF